MYSLKSFFLNDYTKEMIFHCFDFSQRITWRLTNKKVGINFQLDEEFAYRRLIIFLAHPNLINGTRVYIQLQEKKLHLTMLPVSASDLFYLFLIVHSWQLKKSYFKWGLFFLKSIWRNNIWEGTREITEP